MFYYTFLHFFWRFPRLASTALFICLAILKPQWTGQAQSVDGEWTDFENISRTPTASTYPAIATDTSGNVHVFWSEDVGGRTENPVIGADGSPELDPFGRPINYLYHAGNTLFYSRWDGEKWLTPNDIQYNPGGLIDYPQAVVDSQGQLHVVWISGIGADTRLLYSRAPVERAGSAFAWSKPATLAEQILYAYYPAGIAADPSGGLHVLYSQLGGGSGAYVINSTDGGLTWSEPVLLYSTDDPSGNREGVAPTRLASDSRGWLHATWSRYDSGGNGKAIYYAQSRDSGRTWSEPFEVAAWQPGWYEVDWLNFGITGDEIHLVWEGSSRVAAQVERISNDGGLTWSEPHFILPKIVGENGFANLVTDSAGHLYLLVVKRGDPAILSNGVWYTQWDQDQWLEPILLGTHISNLYEIASQIEPGALSNLLRDTLTGDGLRYPQATIVNGNELFVVVVNEWDGEIWSSHTTLNAPYIPPRPYPQPTVIPTLEPTPTIQPLVTLTPIPQYLSREPFQGESAQPSEILLFGVIPALVIVIGFVIYNMITKRS